MPGRIQRVFSRTVVSTSDDSGRNKFFAPNGDH
jgi:hypothetical protein